MERIKVLFVCIHNSARSQMAEAFLNTLAGNKFVAMSAGIEKGNLNPMAIEVMREAGIDISGNKTKSVDDFYNAGSKFDYVITVCDAAHAEQCPFFPGVKKTMHWSFDDPSTFTGTQEEKLERTRQVRDEIRSQVRNFIANINV